MQRFFSLPVPPHLAPRLTPTLQLGAPPTVFTPGAHGGVAPGVASREVPNSTSSTFRPYDNRLSENMPDGWWAWDVF